MKPVPEPKVACPSHWIVTRRISLVLLGFIVEFNDYHRVITNEDLATELFNHWQAGIGPFVFDVIALQIDFPMPIE
jgi:hypothetical protein